MAFVDGYVLPLPKKNLRSYRRMAQAAGRIWREHGALDYRECVGDDLEAPMGMPYTKLLKLKRGETVIFAWITFKSRAHRNRVNKLVINDPRMAAMAPKTMPFDIKRMAYGGFKVIVEP